MRTWTALCALVAAGCAGSAPAIPPTPAPVARAAAAPAAPAVDERPKAANATEARGSAPDALGEVFLGNVAVERGAPGRIRGSAGAELVIHGALGAGAKELALRGLSAKPTGAAIAVALAGYPRRKDRPQARDRAPSWIVDFDTEEVRAVHAKAEADHGKKPAMDDLTRFVSAYIEDKNLARGYDPASVVAKRREGDCTEHAVLLTALGRSFGYAARVVHGFVFVDSNGQLFGAMHAWVEWHSGDRWTLADAAIGSEHDPVYLPLQTLDDESPAFARSLFLTAFQEIHHVVLTPR